MMHVLRVLLLNGSVKFQICSKMSNIGLLQGLVLVDLRIDCMNANHSKT